MVFKKSKWSESNIKLLKEYLDLNKTVEFLATRFETTPNNIRTVMYRNKLFVKNNQSGTTSSFQRKQKQEDLSTRIRILKGEEIRKTDAICFFNDDQLNSWKDNNVDCCVRFCKEVLNVELQDYQVDIIDKMLKHKRFVGVMGRQSGKDFLLACFTVWQCIINSNSKILLVSASQRASDLLYNRILTFIGLSNELFDSIKQSNMEKCVFKNNSEIWSLPATGQIRGQTEVSHVIVNEAFEVPDESFSAVEPMLAVRHGFLYLFSTPKGCIGRLWDAFNNPLFCKVQLPSTVNKYIPLEYFDLQKQTMDSLECDMEINAQFQETFSAFFKLSTIQSISQEYDLRDSAEQDKDYFLGIDWGRFQDYSVLTIVSKNIIAYPSEFEVKTENIIELSKVPFPQQIALIKKLHERYKFIKITPENAGLSIPAVDYLIEAHLPIESFTPTLENKEEGYNNLRKLMEDKKVIIPKSHTKLQYELRTFQYELTETGRMKLHHLSNSSDDFVDSLMMAVHGATKKEYHPYISL